MRKKEVVRVYVLEDAGRVTYIAPEMREALVNLANMLLGYIPWDDGLADSLGLMLYRVVDDSFKIDDHREELT